MKEYKEMKVRIEWFMKIIFYKKINLSNRFTIQRDEKGFKKIKNFAKQKIKADQLI